MLTTGPGGGTEVASLTNGFAAGHQTLVWNGQATGGLVAGTRYRLFVDSDRHLRPFGVSLHALRIAP